MIPKHHEGKRVDCFSSSKLENIEAAQQFYTVAKRRLLDINNWNEVATLPSSTFQLCNSSGARWESGALEGHLIKVDIIGPGLPSSGGYDWVRIDQILEEQLPDGQQITLVLRPTTDPTNQREDIAHFLKNMATSTFLLKQQKEEVSVQYAGRNEVINMENKKFLDNARNALVGLAIQFGGSFPQWKALVEGIVKVD